ncbi:LysR family transcriptional regulator [Rossellomorea sp. KS-H15a]|uniref:LysR family transcriptional regulator n=1 Tax=Rossellomorea sp. KS-H15a TaxID=2963940 RepID=UPI0020C7212D|nr:LysR family transcriptional regulator [Rossellomorea sp. KS-H15a]UTE78700.1 LysR family transcriptional regulator [Rossellomorea sp. KS-H15a]
MELQQLHYFQTVARLEHMTRAAEELRIAQPSLSKTIARLEEDLGVPLFERQHRQIKLNRFGKLFLNRVERIFMEIYEGKREIREAMNLEEHTIRMAVTIPRVLPDLVGSFLKDNPHVRFQQFVHSMAEMKEQLKNGEVDYCISSIPLEDDEDIVWEPLMTEEIFLIVPPGHWLEDREEIDLIEVKDEPFISMNTGYGLRNLTDEICLQAGFSPVISFEGDEPGVIGDLVRQGLGIAFIPAISWMNRRTPFPHKIRIKSPTCVRTIGLGWSKRRHFTRTSKEFHPFMINYFQHIGKKLNQL